MAETHTSQEINDTLVEAFSHLRDVSLRDGIQSWDGNLWRIRDILPALKELNALAVTLRGAGGQMAPVEIWGGGQFLQPAKFLKENPFENLEKIKEAAPDIDLQCLYRGRQAFGFMPVSEEVQKAAIETSANKGIKVFRIFDMMNDIRNAETGINALKEYKENHPEKGVTIEGAVAYVSEPESKKGRAWEIEDYADYALKLAQLGCDEIAIKNYAGVNAGEMPTLIEAIRRKLDENHLQNVPVNLHMHGKQPEAPKAALDAGADKVDVAIGDLSDGPSHANIRSVLKLMLADKGIDIESNEVKNHPVMQQLTRVEQAIHHVVTTKAYTDHDGWAVAKKTNFDEDRGFLKTLKQEDMEKYRMASGALSDLHGRIRKNHKNASSAEQEAIFRHTLENATILWEKAGRFNTVTPGAKILTDQASRLSSYPEILRNFSRDYSAIPMNLYNDDFIDVTIGRYGDNIGMDKGIGDEKFRDALLMYRALRLLNQQAEGSQLQDIATSLFQNNFGKNVSKDDRLARSLLMKNKKFDLADPVLENRLKSYDIGEFARTVEDSNLNEVLKTALQQILSPGRSPTPSAGLNNTGKIIIFDAGGDDPDNKEQQLLAMLLRQKTNGTFDDSVYQGIVDQKKVEPRKAPEPRVRGGGSVAVGKIASLVEKNVPSYP